jgi:sucrose-6-phosphate hydrolase SacC (GH32 family)
LITLRSEDGAEQTTVRLGNLTAGSIAVHGRPADVRISIDRSKSAVPAASDSAVDSPTAHLSAQCTLQPDAKVEPLVDIHVYVDATIMEVFVQGGRVAMTTRVYPTNTNGGLALMSEGCAMELETVEAHALGSIWL